MKDLCDLDLRASLLKALASPDRLRIVRLLAGGPRNVSAIAASLHIPVANLSHHLTVLRNVGLVRDSKQGRFVCYSLSPDVIAPGRAHPAWARLNLGGCHLELDLSGGA